MVLLASMGGGYLNGERNLECEGLSAITRAWFLSVYEHTEKRPGLGGEWELARSGV